MTESTSMKAGFNRRRSSCSEDNWARFRVLYSQEQLDRLSFVFGECEESDKLENFIKVNDRYVNLFCKNMQEVHVWRGYPSTFALRVHNTMKERGAIPASDVAEILKKTNANDDDEDDDEPDLDKVEISKSRAIARERIKNDQEIAIKTSSLFKVLKDLGVDTGENHKWILREMQKIDADETGWFTGDQMLALFREMDSHWELAKIAIIDETACIQLALTIHVGFAHRVLTLLQIAIIDETAYLERDVDNLKAIFNEYAQKEQGTDTATLGVCTYLYMSGFSSIPSSGSSFARCSFRCSAQSHLSRGFFSRLKDVMVATAARMLKNGSVANGNGLAMQERGQPDPERIDFPGFCSCMKKLENEDFCGLKQIMGRKDEIEVDLSLSAGTRTLSYFERKAKNVRPKNASPAK
eukprot:g10952.t1